MVVDGVMMCMCGWGDVEICWHDGVHVYGTVWVGG